MSVVIRTKPSGILYLDIHYGGGKRTKRSTGVKDTAKNRRLLEKEVIPEIEFEIKKGIFEPFSKKVKKFFTVNEYSEIFFDRHSNSRKEHVNQKDLSHFQNHIAPDFGQRRVDSISPMELLDWQNMKLKKYKVSTVKKYRSIFNMILNDALLEELIEKNPFIHVKKPKKIVAASDVAIIREDESINPFNIEEIYELINKADGYLKNFIAILSFTGARPGELIALKWSDIDFNNEIISISKTRVRGQNGSPKTKASYRKIEMLPIVKEYLIQQYEITNNNINNEVFCNSSGKPFYSHDIIAKRFSQLLADNDNRYLYQLRHSFASIMISNDEEIMWVSQMMGHENIDITLKVYTHFYKTIEDKNKRKKRALFLKTVPLSSHLDDKVA